MKDARLEEIALEQKFKFGFMLLEKGIDAAIKWFEKQETKQETKPDNSIEDLLDAEARLKKELKDVRNRKLWIVRGLFDNDECLDVLNDARADRELMQREARREMEQIMQRERDKREARRGELRNEIKDILKDLLPKNANGPTETLPPMNGPFKHDTDQ